MTLGIDPGKDGALVVLEHGKVIHALAMPTVGTEIDLLALSKFFAYWSGKITMVYIEDVHAIFGSSAKATFQFGRGLGMLEALIVANSLPYQKRKPKEWQAKAFQGIPEFKKPNGKRDTKAMALLAVRRLHPDVELLATPRSTKPHEGIVDAILIGG